MHDDFEGLKPFDAARIRRYVIVGVTILVLIAFDVFLHFHGGWRFS